MTVTPQSTLLIAGASGVIGSGALEYFAQLPDWNVIAMSRRRPLVKGNCEFSHESVDLADHRSCAEAIASLPPVTHLIYAAAAEAPGLVSGWQDPGRMALNGAMFDNLLLPLAARGHLQHVSLLQGAKAYGAHVHPVPAPLHEDAPRDPHPNFYWLQEDTLRACALRHGFAFTIWRPQIVIGTAPGAAMNPVLPIAAYALICRERGLPFALPGNSSSIWELIDIGLLAEALAWGASQPVAFGQTFNITNGDAFVLRANWCDLAKQMKLDHNGTPPVSFVSFFAEEVNQHVWASLAKRYRLVEPSLIAFLGESHHYLDLLSSARVAERPPVLLSTIKLRKAGFGSCLDSRHALLSQLRDLADLRLVPPLI